jgi:hypothetical protein
MKSTSLTFAAAAALLAGTAAHAQAPCSLLTPEQVKAVVNTTVGQGQPGGSKEAPDCTWKDAKGPNMDQPRVYLGLKTRDNYNVVHAQMQNTGRAASVTGVGEDAFFVTSPAGSTAYLYVLAKHHLVLLQVNIPNATRLDNEAAEKGLASEIVAKL